MKYSTETFDLDKILDQYFKTMYTMLIALCWTYVLFIYFIMKMHTVAYIGILLSIGACSALPLKPKLGLKKAGGVIVFFGFFWVLLFLSQSGGAFSPGVTYLGCAPFAAGIFQGKRSAIFWSVLSFGSIALMIVFKDYLPPKTFAQEQMDWFLTSTFIGVSALLLVALKFGDLLTYAAVKIETEKKDDQISQISEELHVKEKSYSAIFENSPIGILTLDLNLNLMSTNPALSEFLGFTEEELGQKNLFDLIYAPDQKLLGALKSKEDLQASAFPRTECRFVSKNGVDIWGAISAKSVPTSEHEQNQIFTVIENVSDLKTLEAKRSEADKLIQQQQVSLIASSKMSALGEMAGGIAHEINNPLAIIQAKTFQLKKRVTNQSIDQPTLVNDLSKIESTTMRIAKIVRGLRSFSRNSDDDPMEYVKVSQIVEETLELCSERFNQAQIDLKVNPIPNNLSIHCQSTQISQVIMNLLANAYDAVENLEEKWVKLEVHLQADDMVISIIDSGKGIFEEISDKIMNPFFTTKEVGKGTGLGLSISKGIVEKHKGTLKYNQFYKNTQFILTLPASVID